MGAQRLTIGTEVDRNEGNREVGGPSHAVILGAGASIASTIYAPEPSGNRLPSLDNLIDSVLAYFPRRSGENFMHRFLPSTPDEAFQEPNTVPKRFGSLEEMWEWHQPLFDAEFEAERT